MDELYGNAWGDSSDLAGDIQLSQPTWTSEKLATHDDEADLAAPSWSTGAGVQWNEPSDETHGFKWSANDPDLAWAPESVYQDIQIQKTASHETEPEDESSLPTSNESDEEEKADKTKAVGFRSLDDSRSISTLPTEEHNARSSTPHSRSSSPDDGFGTFETGLVESVEQYSAHRSQGIEDDAWSSPWVGSVPTDSEETEGVQIDEWEAARRQKEQMDRKIPPEVLANLIAQCTDFFGDAKPENSPAGSEAYSWMDQWRDGLGAIEGLETLVKSVIPDLTLQAPAQFTKTAIAKNMASAVRVTKNLPLTRNSPFSHYLAAKGSIAWESAIKERKLVVEEDVVPVGWRILEKLPVLDATDTSKAAKPSGGIFSFWGRKHSKTASTGGDSSDRISSPPTRPSSVPPVDANVTIRRESQDSATADTPSKESPKPSTTVAEPLPSTPNVTAVTGGEQTEASLSYADAFDPHTDESQSASPQPPPSAVSRFLTRFSRKRSSLGTSSTRSSLALSADDLDVLSDIVPSAHDGVDDEPLEILRTSVSDILKADPLPPTLPPPPTASVVRQHVPTISVRTSVDELAPTKPRNVLPVAPLSNNDLHDLLGVFESSDTSGRAEASPLSAVSLIAAPSGALGDMSTTITPVSPIPLALQASQPGTPASPFYVSATVHPKSFLPPPVAPSPRIRTETPLSSTQPGLMRASSTDSTSGSRSSHPTLPPLISIPPPPSILPIPQPSSSSSSSSSRSETPLAQLYPNAAAFSRIASSSSARTPSPFVLDPPSRSRNHTPIMVDGPSKPAVPPPLLPPPPTFSGNSTLAVPSTDFFGNDDDDFADFQTSAQPTPVIQFSAVQSTGVAVIPPFSGQKIPVSTPVTPPTPPAIQPSSLRSNVPLTPQPLSSDPFNDEFSAFFSSSSSPSFKSHTSRNSGLDSDFASDKSLFKTYDTHVEFDDFVSSPSSSALRTPSPPRPPTKLAKPSLSLALPHIAVDTVPHLTREEKKNQHQRTLSLLERAAAKPGQWPAPPSPLPQALSFPISMNTPQKVDLMGGDVDDSFGAFQLDTLAPSGSGISFLSPPATSSQARPASFGDAQKVAVSTPVSTPGLQLEKAKTSGGLSAQDLSFFEGL